MNTDSHLGLFFYKNTFCLLEGKHNDLQLTELITAHSHPTSTLHHVIIQRQHGALEIMNSLIQLHKTNTFSVPYKHIQSNPAKSFPHAAFCPSQKRELLLFLQWLFDLYSKFKRQKFCCQEWILRGVCSHHTWMRNIHGIHIDWTTLFITILEWESDCKVPHTKLTTQWKSNKSWLLFIVSVSQRSLWH